MVQKYKKWLAPLFAAYCVLMLWLLFGQRWGQSGGGLNLELLRTLKLFWRVIVHGGSRAQKIHAVVNLLGNVVMFVPLGFLVPCLWCKMQHFGWHILTMITTIVAVEVLQLLLGLGTCDVDDLLLNLVGTTLGFVVFKLWNIWNRRGED